jgi:hypothetical protein
VATLSLRFIGVLSVIAKLAASVSWCSVLVVEGAANTTSVQYLSSPAITFPTPRPAQKFSDVSSPVKLPRMYQLKVSETYFFWDDSPKFRFQNTVKLLRNFRLFIFCSLLPPHSSDPIK